MSDTAQAQAQAPVEASAPTDGTAPPAEGATNGTPPAEGQKEKEEARSKAGLYISTPDVLRDKIAEEAAKENKTERVFVRDLLAKMWGLTLPAPRTRSVYSSPQERDAAQLAKRKARAALIKQLLEEHAAKQAAGTA